MHRFQAAHGTGAEVLKMFDLRNVEVKRWVNGKNSMLLSFLII